MFSAIFSPPFYIKIKPFYALLRAFDIAKLLKTTKKGLTFNPLNAIIKLEKR